MKLTTIHVERKFNLGNYESISLGGEFMLDEGDTLEGVTSTAAQTINTMFSMMQGTPASAPVAPQSTPTTTPVAATPSTQPAAAPASKAKKRITLSENRNQVQAIMNRLMLTGDPIKEEDKGKKQYAGQTVYPYITMEQLLELYDFDQEAYNAINICVVSGQKKL